MAREIDAEPAREETVTYLQPTIDTGWELHSNRELAMVFEKSATWRDDPALHREIIKRLRKIS